MIESLLILLFGLVGQWCLGWAVAGWFLNGLRSRNGLSGGLISATERAGLGFVLGIGVTAAALFVWAQCGGKLGSATSLTLALAGWISAAPSLASFIVPRRMNPKSIAIQPSSLRAETAFCRLCQIVIAALFVSALVQTLLTPQHLWDERAIFGLKAAVLFEDRTIGSRDLKDPLFVQGHPRYPLLIPLAEQHIYALLGTVDDRLGKLVFPMLYAGLVLTIAGALSRRVAPSTAWLTAVLLATIPALMPDDYGFLCGQADAAAGCFHGVTIFYLWDAIEQSNSEANDRRRWLGTIALAGFLGALTAFTKDEGIAFLMVDCGILNLLVISSWLTGKASHTPAEPASVIQSPPPPTEPAAVARWPSHQQSPALAEDAVNASPSQHATRDLLLVTIMYTTVAVAVLTPWFAHRRGLPLIGEMNYFARMTPALFMERLPTLTWTIPHLLHRMFSEWSERGLQWWFMLATLLLAPRRAMRSSQVLCLLDIVGSLAALVVAGMFAPVRLEEHIGGSSHRFLMQIAPVAVLFVAGQRNDRARSRS